MEPQLGLGLWNAWLFFLYYWLPMPLLKRFRPDVLAALSSGEPDAGERRRRGMTWLLLLVGLGYSLFLPLQVGTSWFYTGMPIALAGAAFFGWAVRAMIVWPDLGEPLMSGAYRLSRHPLYFGEAVMFVGAAIACSSILLMLFGVVSFTVHVRSAVSEEAECLERHGEAYARYLARTPRWFGLPRRD